MKGLVSGRTSAVNAFCRFPTFAVALERRVGAILGTAFVDDAITMEVVLSAFSARKFFVEASNLLGAVFGEHKTRCPSSQARCSGVYLHLEDVDSNRITIEPVSGAGRARGRAGWALMAFFARTERNALAPRAWSYGGSHFPGHGHAVQSSAPMRGDSTCANAHPGVQRRFMARFRWS